ncbi:glycosyltransferase family 4 protein [Apilactobacillus timberlakei]|uniref:Glycosyltransferase family 4 protein n=1 Tax=Apilactobacillus timberlakei TaxID=2008380 RepID=A0ABY2YUQ7_9LACO|nr:glycosyltransferase family 4 protein [Apilactobacillus timberlakei]TPR14554.1 glycosyltransferase family 4 protein [Apilactobacillus timberlakei]TPR14567.1 glycosyltransferase family 4 protein [Apilactobacillus timberlakei]TPR15893.1 glycosyltransferase family 4 protein [Apilactobacillus timberlakei]TPR17324.1 glycosyltransferase family 4 protein [Apilactobacillus timberlakei]TPR18419.1 glycosyltransferase family 4 protein [Apilactobacillus timberlakei]
MNIGIFTDTYFPQVSGVATSIKTLKDQLENNGHQVYIFTTTDPHVSKNTYEKNIFRFSSIPFVSFTDRRIAVRGMFQAYQIAKKLNLDIIHTQTEFSMGMIGKFVSKFLRIPCLHTYHTMYEDYLHYVANGKLLKPVHVKEATLAFCHNMSGVIAPSKRVLDTLVRYGIKSPIRIIPTGVNINKFDVNPEKSLKSELGYKEDVQILLSVSRLAYEKNISGLIDIMPKIINEKPKTQLMIVGDGPAKKDLEKQVQKMNLSNNVKFIGEISNDRISSYYHLADLFVSCSSSESQGLTYIEAMASGVKVVVTSGPYTDDLLDNKALGMTFSNEDEFVSDIIGYLDNKVKFNSNDANNIRAKKLHEISAQNFADRVTAFYKNAQIEYNNQIRNSTRIND